MTKAVRSVRRNLGVAVIAAVFLVLSVYTLGAIRSLGNDLRQAREDNRVLAQQVRDLGGTPRAGPAGERGPSGTPGQTGAPGAPGSTGQRGPTGPQGPKGDTGQQGGSGSPGATVTGPPGPAGPSGAPGKDGQDGAPGADGKDGQDGEPGPACPSGYHTETVTIVTAGGPRSAAACVQD